MRSAGYGRCNCRTSWNDPVSQAAQSSGCRIVIIALGWTGSTSSLASRVTMTKPLPVAGRCQKGALLVYTIAGVERRPKAMEVNQGGLERVVYASSLKVSTRLSKAVGWPNSLAGRIGEAEAANQMLITHHHRRRSRPTKIGVARRLRWGHADMTSLVLLALSLRSLRRKPPRRCHRWRSFAKPG